MSNVPGLQEIPVPASIRPLDDSPSSVIVPAPPLQASTSNLPSEYDCDEYEIDESTIAALDALEARFAHGQPLPGASPLTAKPSIYTRADVLKRGPPSPQTSSASKKGKTSPKDSLDTTNSILEGFENEIMCPICFDIMVAAHLCNPCGHSCCGECAQGWISQNKTSPACAVCRAVLTTTKPLLPNYSLDAVVQQYIRARAASGRSEWQEKGDRLAEWRKRHEKWKRIALMVKAKENPPHRRTFRGPIISYAPPVYEPFGSYYEDDEDDEDEDPTYEDDEIVEIVPRRRALALRLGR